MKKIIAIATIACLFFACLAASVFAQPLPTGPVSSEPDFESKRLTHITAYFENDNCFTAEFEETGAVTNMMLHLSGKGGKETRHGFPDNENEYRSFTNILEWKKFAEGFVSRYAALDDDTYVETVSYEFIAHSQPVVNREPGWRNSALIFKNGARYLSVSGEFWIGEVPAVGDKVYIGRDMFQNTFFPVEKSGMKYLLELPVANRLAHDRRAREEYARKIVEKTTTENTKKE